ncbi:MCP four helix bundle domain-containing protein [Massilia violaceinigra]|uniref:MCP four helix bundle domain-containing protein n=1 Tax=Massilia violaceinigra TaxID=2045208 RepID=A0ABY4A9S3_9BURK|nr:methyl-accepting chemotaxis protein [Massilia violaceinigra]UOD30419.1 MCP four helix bundle domain-containing protein [Massilia violaceinigra]
MKNLSIGTRLTLGFAVVLLFLVALTGIGVWRMQQAGVLTDNMVKETVRNERLIDEWAKVIEVNAARTTTAWKVTDPADQKTVEAQMKLSSARATEIQTILGESVKGARPKALLEQVLETRKAYTAARATVFRLKAAGDMAGAAATFETDMAQKRETYLAALAALSSEQRTVLDTTAAAIAAQYESGRSMLISLGVLAIVMGIACAVWITGTITRPIRAAVRVAETVASGDLTSRIDVDSRDETGQLMQSLKRMNDSLVDIVGEVRGGTDAIGTASREIASGNLDLSSRTEDQASSLQETASAMDQLTSTVKLNADNAREANQLAISAAAVAIRGGAVVSDVVATMSSINASSTKIVDIIGVIDGIAFQTNILALNAAVEAARAGEQGRGFAVVASEVRTLAQRSAAAAKEIKELISDSVGKVDNGTRLVDQAGKTMEEVVTSINRVTRIMNDITSASDEQRDGIEQVNLAVTQMDQVTQQNAALVEQAAAAAAAMQEQAAQLSQVVGVFKLGQMTAGRRELALLGR